jgi:hypothetical protein
MRYFQGESVSLEGSEMSYERCPSFGMKCSNWKNIIDSERAFISQREQPDLTIITI